MIEVAEARARLLRVIEPGAHVEVPLREAWGRILAEPVVTDRDIPPTDRSAMDGFAVRSADFGAGREFRLTGEVRAGQDASGVVVGEGQAVRIFTGATVPRGADAVVMQELAKEDRSAGTVRFEEAPAPGHNVRRRGEDRASGETLVPAGVPLSATAIGAAAAAGCAQLRVVPSPRVAILPTGDEIVAVTAKPAPHQVRNSNAEMLLAALTELRVDARVLGAAGDEAGALDAALAEGLTGDVLLVTGGVSVGAYDLVGDALQRAGCEVLFHNVAMRPGKPILAARSGRRLVLGLPGNPVSAFTGYHVFVVPALRKLMGHAQPVIDPVRATLSAPLARRRARLTYHLARLSTIEGRPSAAPIASMSSGDLAALSRANAFIIAAGDAETPLPAGSEVDVLRW